MQWPHLAAIARAPGQLKPGDPVRRYLENAGISRSCDHLVELMDPIVHALNLMQEKKRTIGEAVEIWIEMLGRIPKSNTALRAVVQRSKQALECPFFLLANVLDPRWAGESLSPTQLDLVRKFAEEEGPSIANALNLYMSKSPPFRPTMFNKLADPIAFWQAGAKAGFPQDLCSLGIRLCSCLASTATLERNFSTMGHVFGRKRTRLGIEKAGKLTFLYRALNARDASDSEYDSE